MLHTQISSDDKLSSDKKLNSPPAEDQSLENFCCPITDEIFKDPVSLSDGQTYERSAIEEWLKDNNTSPVTNLILTSKVMTTNWVIKKAIEEYHKKIIPTLQTKDKEINTLEKTLAETRSQLARTAQLLKKTQKTLTNVNQFLEKNKYLLEKKQILEDNKDLLKNNQQESSRYWFFPCCEKRKDTTPDTTLSTSIVYEYK